MGLRKPRAIGCGFSHPAICGKRSHESRGRHIQRAHLQPPLVDFMAMNVTNPSLIIEAHCNEVPHGDALAT